MRADADVDGAVGPDGEHDADVGDTTDAVDRALAAFRAGDPVCVHDFADREGETDIVYPAAAVDAAAVAHMRNDAGGLVCVAVADHIADAFGLPFLAEALDHPAVDDSPDYDDRSSFSLPVNHRETFTGITDADRALTIAELAAAAAAVDGDPEAYDADDFAASFRAPGHVHVLRGARAGIDDRVGHTELGLAMAEAVDAAPAAVVCEMLDDETGAALTPADAAAYAARRDIPYVEGSALVAALQ
ncbi:3,4-dihydroxy-2-butanone-4-phosphate synthase [Halorubrum sp. JWXQ-INN 858]|uniref:3,4-dihydroxy-2-butanone-4-phosphate synthase n=1 Tax=Halorubrum sp. JWXQ-INN 858 TaxID=2690782 RepID=UPI00135BF08C|nr:3,4-dihydroxy-2-butanone-4-phosphate synthase [Halorubrum sp. JWXQ-INN 858]MWV65303.1 3,4-dihydroxy-2-butanone-4-phosphate synthase [Halorubrum sp. JWXQ-INN 858]